MNTEQIKQLNLIRHNTLISEGYARWRKLIDIQLKRIQQQQFKKK